MTRSIYKAKAKRIFFNIFVAIFIAALFGLAIYYFTVGMVFIPIVMITFCMVARLIFEFIYFLVEQSEESSQQKAKGKIALAKEVFHFGPKSEGCIYLIKVHSDGIYKIGLTRQANSRIASYIRKHGSVEVLVLWKVPALRSCETQALLMTGNYNFYHNGITREYRRMDEQQVNQFIEDFTNYLDSCYERTN
jgi:hypothetical protein